MEKIIGMKWDTSTEFRNDFSVKINKGSCYYERSLVTRFARVSCNSSRVL